MTATNAKQIYGMLDVLILKTVSRGRMHGLEISRQIHRLSREMLNIEQGALYPALHRLEAEGLLEAEWDRSENNRKARFYLLTEKGQARLGQGTESWIRNTEAISRVLDISWSDLK